MIRIIIASFLSIATNLAADSVFTWTDEEGNLHITNALSPEKAKLKAVINYTPEAGEDIIENENQPIPSDDTSIEDENLQKARELGAKTEKARKEALEARAKAEEAARKRQEFIDRHGRNKKMQKINRYKLRKVNEAMKAAVEQAQLAEEKALKAEKEEAVAVKSQNP